MADLPELINQLGSLTVLEAAELSKMLRERLERPLKRKHLSFNEGKVCDAVVRRLEAREQQVRANLRWPEQENHQHPVEVVFDLGSQLYALEHTGIERFDGHIRMEAQTEKLFAPITTALKDALGTDALFELYLPVNSLNGRKAAQLSAIQQAIIDWVKTTAPTIPKRPYPDYKGNGVGLSRRPNVPFDVALCRFEPPIVPGKHFQIRHTVDDVEKLRRDRMKAAIDKKFPKLAAWKANEGAKSILVLEQNDIQLTNPSIVADVYLPLAKAREDRPDETYLVASCMSPNWWMWPILIGDRSYDDYAKSDDPSFWEFEPSKLASLTKR
ncbi:hypothetical protein MA20_44355 [Bradyrhizobium japonicum]|uniref:Uncharacterized protein n=2 Tax=Bradyrhizobium japonicum TaxID=375 RepID=A0A0A3XGL9_BRAJP|nr:hypothetical protein MA20_44355 [Bradyrhizobium japonicum]